ncbi:hypothetical protein AVEN_211797-1 [Araneus ventricosus]|uniref:DUF5641 domain-containing protein n=1 Tax=Araneus ventricosus TaxID=182803 RepID=A0A4Y2Q0W0_ARAVE|nr:hypothetical protein AVEN_211797-1 [Araneus ventricosus]
MQDLTPAMFFFEISTAEVKDLDVRDANHFRERLRFRAKVIEELRKRFRSEYLGQLIQRQKQDPQSSNIREGDIVLIGDDVKKTSSMAFGSRNRTDSRKGWTSENC